MTLPSIQQQREDNRIAALRETERYEAIRDEYRWCADWLAEADVREGSLRAEVRDALMAKALDAARSADTQANVARLRAQAIGATLSVAASADRLAQMRRG